MVGTTEERVSVGEIGDRLGEGELDERVGDGERVGELDERLGVGAADVRVGAAEVVPGVAVSSPVSGGYPLAAIFWLPASFGWTPSPVSVASLNPVHWSTTVIGDAAVVL